MNSNKRPAGVFPEKGNTRWTVWDNSPRRPTVTLKAQYKDKMSGEYKNKTSLFLDELKRLVSAGAEAIEKMEQMTQEVERASALGADAVPFEFPGNLDDDSIDF